MVLEFGSTMELSRIAHRRPHGGFDGWGAGLLGAIRICNILPLFTAFTAIAPLPQLWLLLSNQGVEVISKASLASQSILFLVLAASWPLRFKMPPEIHWSRRIPFSTWYQAFYGCVDSLLFAVSQGVLWWCVKDAADKTSS